jgi:molecular chaperone GrpE
VTAPSTEGEPEQPIIRDKRRIDPVTGALRPDTNRSLAADPPPAAAPPAAAPPIEGGDAPDSAGLATAELEQHLAERTADLQRLQAEYANYRRRVDRDREGVREAALASVLTGLLPVLDDIGRARGHGELSGGFKSVAEALEAMVEKLGLSRFGEVGEPFDPTVHEALVHSYSGEVSETTCVDVFQPGYRLGSRVVRPARVAVADPTTPDVAAGPEPVEE